MSIQSLNNRLKELGTRKVMGAQFRHITLQFLTDSFVINLIAVTVALTIFQLIKSPAETLLGFYAPSLGDIAATSAIIIALLLTTGALMMGLYPVFLVRKREPIELLKRSVRGFRLNSFNSWLVTTQYISAIVLIICITTIFSQLDYILKK